MYKGFFHNNYVKIKVLDVFKVNKVFVHKVIVESGEVSLDDILNSEVDVELRKAIARNHSATHLLHAALYDVLGDHISQAGSYNDATRLRFDFSHPKAMTAEEIAEVEEQVN